MTQNAVFANLIFDEADHPVPVAFVGGEPCYVVDDQGFQRHIPSRDVDLQVLRQMAEMIQGNEELLATLAAAQLGQEDIFSRAIIENQIRNVDVQFEQLLQSGIPEEVRAYLGMMGFKIHINIHGEVLSIDQPGTATPEEEE
jgi:hypothetical protein